MKPNCLEIAKAAGLGPGKTSGAEVLFLCPCHDDHDPSLKINPSKNAWTCHVCNKSGGAWQLAAFLARCDPSDKTGISAFLRKISISQVNGKSGKPVMTIFRYCDETRTELYQVVRSDWPDGSETFYQRHLDKRGNFIPNLKGVRPVLYRLPELISELKEKPAGQRTAYLAEGEKGVDALRERGLTATTNSGGAGKWLQEHTKELHQAGAETLVILADNGTASASHARKVARSCLAAGLKIKVPELPDLRPKGDVCDFFGAGHTKDQLEEIVRDTPEKTEADLLPAGRKKGDKESGSRKTRAKPVSMNFSG
jgi:hypothetical protein